MRRSLLTLALYHADAGAELLIGHIQTEIPTQRGPEFGLAAQLSPLRLTRRMSHRSAPIEHGEAANASTLTLIRQAFEAACVRFTDDGGIVPPR